MTEQILESVEARVRANKWQRKDAWIDKSGGNPQD
jgi:hypothetical protein